MIKQIQLRGISRSPSDRMTEDGGLDESLNIYLDTAESAPALVPEDVTSRLGLQDAVQAEKVFIHKTSNYEHPIVQEGNLVSAYVGGRAIPILTLGEGEDLRDIASIGNIIIITTTSSAHYALWKNSEYKYIGDSLPVPSIKIDVIGNNDDSFYGKSGGTIKMDTTSGVPGFMAIAQFQKSAWERAARGVEETETDKDVNAKFQELQNQLWLEVQSTKTKIGKWGYFSCPRLVRYAIRLYDGSYINHSVPILIGAGEKEWLSVTSRYVDAIVYGSIDYRINLFYKAVAKLVKWEIEDWTDIIAGVDIFISEDITYPRINEDFASCDDGGGKIYFKGYEEEFENAKEEVLNKVNFYKVISVASGDLDSLKAGIDLHGDNDVEQSSTLVVKERLTSDYMAGHKIIPSSTMVYNNRLIGNANKIILPDPYSHLNGLFNNTRTAAEARHQREKKFRLKFYVRNNSGEECTIMARTPEGSTEFVTPLMSDGEPSQLETTFYAEPMAWIAYPDANCYRVDIDLGGGDVATVKMSAHPGLNCSYAFIGLDKYLYDETAAGDVELDDEERPSYSVNNYVVMSELNNPFVFPVAGRYTLQSKIIGIALATTALSQGQFGQFPLYVFTEDGIWAMETAADGSFVTSKPLSRDVCVNPDSITSIDNAVVFVTDKGVMLVQGSQVVNISPFMTGRHYTINQSAKDILETSDYASLLPSLTDTDTFMGFVKKASVAYDYAGKRLIFIARDEAYQYVYKLDTQTWHKLKHEVELIEPINSYPECLVRGSDGFSHCVYDLSTILDGTREQSTELGCLITRPLALGYADVKKVIKDIRIRGEYAKGHVQYILQGSDDGVNYFNTSLKQKSWKLFRIIIVCALDRFERISWIDVDYDIRYNNKLR